MSAPDQAPDFDKELIASAGAHDLEVHYSHLPEHSSVAAAVREILSQQSLVSCTGLSGTGSLYCA